LERRLSWRPNRVAPAASQTPGADEGDRIGYGTNHTKLIRRKISDLDQNGPKSGSERATKADKRTRTERRNHNKTNWRFSTGGAPYKIGVPFFKPRPLGETDTHGVFFLCTGIHQLSPKVYDANDT
jgi:hypothetical protein